MCGEHTCTVCLFHSSPGSSPHVRGARSQGVETSPVPGIIPACAGSTMAGMRSHSRAWDHPRMCGEHARSRPPAIPWKGSSPHVRGAPIRSRWAVRARGIIPACAGSTPLLPAFRRASRDHPRMCGEHRTVNAARIPASGSSPHVRGAQAVGFDAGGEVGIIPACAGSTCPHRRRWTFTWDHPRMCGEHDKEVFAALAAAGSSPHVRGALEIQGVAFLRDGIIPACAGSTSRIRDARSDPWDHPRMCGEHTSKIA